MENKEPQKKQGTVDKVLFGLVIGGAIGSVLGLSVAPEKGKELRKNIKSTSDKAVKKGKAILDKHEDAVSLVTNKSKGIVSKMVDRVLGKKTKKKEHPILDWINDMVEIPNEAEEEISQ